MLSRIKNGDFLRNIIRNGWLHIAADGGDIDAMATTAGLGEAYDDAVPLAEIIPSFRSRCVPIETDVLGRPTNPSIACFADGLWMLVRVLNYVIEYDGQGLGSYRHLERMPAGGPLLRTRNLLVKLDAAGTPLSDRMVAPPLDWPAPRFPSILGFEDSRLFAWRGEPWCLSSIRETHSDGVGRMILARIDGLDTDAPRLAEPRVLDPGGVLRDEKNWMPLTGGDALRFVYTIDPVRILDETGRTVAQHPPRDWPTNRMRGGTPLLAFDGGWLGIEHELIYDRHLFYYYHRWIWLDADYALRRFSRRFYFTRVGVEFAAGLCWSPDGTRLMVSFGVEDCSCHVGICNPDEVRRSLDEEEPDFSGSISFLRETPWTPAN